MNKKKDTDKRMKFMDFVFSESGKHNPSVFPGYVYYHIFGLYKYNPSISHWKNFCNRLKWPLSHEKLENVIISPGEKIYAIFITSTSLTYAVRGGPKYLAFWLWLILILMFIYLIVTEEKKLSNK